MKNCILTVLFCMFGGIVFAQPYMMGQQGGCTGTNATATTCQNYINWQTQQALIASDQQAIDAAQAKLKADEDAFQANQAQANITAAQTNLTALQTAQSGAINTTAPATH